MKKKLCVMLSVMMFCMVFLPGYGLASPADQGQKIIDIAPVPQSTNFLQYWGNDITGTSSHSVSVQGETLSYTTVDKLTISMNLEIWDGSDWEVFNSWRETEYNARNIELIEYCDVYSGYYYRVTTIHTAINNGVTETKTTISDSIAVN